MTCCGTSADPSRADLRDLGYWVVEHAPGRFHLDLLVPEVRCATCIAAVEGAVGALPRLSKARVNLTTRRLSAEWEGARDPADILEAVVALGYHPTPVDAAALDEADDTRGRELVRALAVTGFAAANVMLLSVSVWSGADGATRDLFHWLSALIALPAVLYGGRPFFRSAWGALRSGRVNMDVPIALAVVLAAGVSLGETLLGNEHAYFDASVSLLFFLLLGRVLDHQMRVRARTAASQLLARMARAVTVREPDGALTYRPIEDLRVGEIILLAAGEHVPLDGVVVEGTGAIDASVATGEAVPVTVRENDLVLSGMVNAGGPLAFRVTATAQDSFLSRMISMMERAETGRAGYERLADRIARLYAPVVHGLALATFLGWLVLGQGWHPAMMAAVATLIITCPCALGLAVPVVQVVASDMLFREGVMVKDAAALETLSGVDAAVFDKTGTLTSGDLHLAGSVPDKTLALAAGLARESTHPISRALVREARARGLKPVGMSEVREEAGRGLVGIHDGRIVRLGSAQWSGATSEVSDAAPLPSVFLAIDEVVTRISFFDTPRDGAAQALSALASAGVACEVLSGDREGPVAALAKRVGLSAWRSGCTPADKVARIEVMKAAGRRVLFVGDGLNDGPALRAADVAMAPASAADIGRAAADVVFLRNDLRAVPRTLQVARGAMRLVRQNVGLAIAYNLVAVPLAMMGQVTPLVAALAMSGSSILVTGNALRLRWGRHAPAVPSIGVGMGDGLHPAADSAA